MHASILFWNRLKYWNYQLSDRLPVNSNLCTDIHGAKRINPQDLMMFHGTVMKFAADIHVPKTINCIDFDDNQTFHLMDWHQNLY